MYAITGEPSITLCPSCLRTVVLQHAGVPSPCLHAEVQARDVSACPPNLFLKKAGGHAGVSSVVKVLP